MGCLRQECSGRVAGTDRVGHHRSGGGAGMRKAAQRQTRPHLRPAPARACRTGRRADRGAWGGVEEGPRPDEEHRHDVHRPPDEDRGEREDEAGQRDDISPADKLGVCTQIMAARRWRRYEDRLPAPGIRKREGHAASRSGARDCRPCSPATRDVPTRSDLFPGRDGS